MASGTSPPRTPYSWPWQTYLLGYLAVLVSAEILIAFQDPVSQETPFQEWGLALHILLVFALIFHGVLIHGRKPTGAYLLTAVSLASLLRIYSLAIPRYTFTILEWLGLVSVPLLISVAAVAYVQRLRPKELGLGIGSLRQVHVQTAIAVTGVPLGILEFFILRPDAWIEEMTVAALVGGSLVIFLATGISEELIFRGIMLKRAVEGLGSAPGLLFVSTIFASLHIFFLSAADLAFVFLVGLFYGVSVLKTRSLWGVILSHSLGNVVLYLLAPFAFA